MTCTLNRGSSISWNRETAGTPYRASIASWEAPNLFSAAGSPVTPDCRRWIAPDCLRPSLDDVVGAGEQHRRHLEAERPGGPQIDHQLEFDRLLNGQITRFLSLENTPGVNPGLAIRLRNA